MTHDADATETELQGAANTLADDVVSGETDQAERVVITLSLIHI